MGLTLAQIDRMLTDWQRKADIANQNLLDLSDLPAYQRLSGMGNPPSNVTGITQQQASMALTAIDRLFEDSEIFNQQIERAKKMRRELPALFINDSQLREIEHIFMGMSIELPSIQTPLADRDLLSVNQQVRSISLAMLLDKMMLAFAIARDTFVAVDSAWTELESKLITIYQSWIELQKLVQQLQISPPSSLITIQTNFTNLQLEIDRDPLGINRTLIQDLIPLIDTARSELTTLDRQRQQLQSDLEIANRDLQQLNRLNRDAIAAYTDSQSKISHSLQLISPLPVEEIAELEQWLARLVAKFGSGTISAVRVGLTNWQHKVRAYLSVVESALAANRLPLDNRQELRGRLDALAAKALAKGKAEDPVLTALCIQARELLYASPTDLNLAIDLVREYERCLNQRLAC
jgi:hypothetical protein